MAPKHPCAPPLRPDPDQREREAHERESPGSHSQITPALRVD
jgi:hypothetical protein